MVIAPINEGLLGQIFVSGVVVDNGNGACGPDIVIVFGDVVFGIGNIDVGLTLMVAVNLLAIGDNLTALFGIAGDVGDGNRQLNFQMKFY